MKILIVYGTTEGHTRKIAMFVADCIRRRGGEASLLDATDLPKDLEVGAFDAVIVAGSLHQGRHQTSIDHFISDNLVALQERPGALLSVSLAAIHEDKNDARECVEALLDKTGWRPTRIELVAGALLYTQYDFFKRWIMKTIVKKEGGPIDTSQDYEFTDWEALEAFTTEFFDGVNS